MVLSAWWTTFKKHRENLIQRTITNTYNLSIETTLKKLRENQKYKSKPKTTNKSFGKTNKNKVVKGFRRTLGYGFGLVWFVGFPEGLFGCLKTVGKTNKPNKTKPISKGGSETVKNCLLVFTKFCLVFVGCLWYVWFSLCLFVF